MAPIVFCLDNAKGLAYGDGKPASGLEDATVAPLEDLRTKLALSPGFRRVGGFLLLLLVGWLDYITGPEIAFAPFYILILLGLGFYEPWGICLAYSGLAAITYLGADLLWNPARATLVYPYWRALARLFSFALISSTISQLVRERTRLRLSEQALQEKAQELEEKNRRLEETLRELKRLQEDLIAKERQAAIAETIYLATYEIERPLVSISIYVEELLQTVQRGEDIYPTLEKIGERVQDMERILKDIRKFRKGEGG